jgi:hypothetical protein
MSLRAAHVNPQLRAGHGGRFGRGILRFFIAGLVITIGLAALGAVLGGPKKKAVCPTSAPCAAPPRLSQPLEHDAIWHSSQYGFSVLYPSGLLSVAQQSASHLTLEIPTLNDGSSGLIFIDATPASGGSSAQAIVNQIDSLNGLGQVGVDDSSADALLGPGVGYRAGVGQVFTGYETAPQGVGQPLTLASQAATDGHVIIAVTVVGPATHVGPMTGAYALGDEVINGIQWPGGP